MPATCEATRRDGERCQTRIVGNGPYCFGHDPAMREKRTAARRQGGQNKANRIRLAKIMPLRLVPVWEQLEQALADVLTGDLDPKQASAAASVARALVAVQQAGEVEERLRKLEEGSA
jgi:hypothetical protein